MTMWAGLERMPWFWRVIAKGLLFLTVLVGVLYPHPVYLVRQVGHLRDTEALIQPDLPFIAEINREIDAKLPEHPTKAQELAAVERYVYQAIRYSYDWDIWMNVDYWPTAAEVWEKRTEDCDGRAVLSASILRARGFKDAKIVANINHAWVEAGGKGLMGAEKDQNFRREGGKLVITLPKKETLFTGLAQVRHFPAWRLAVLVLAAVLLVLHPARCWKGFATASLSGFSGLALLYVWAMHSEGGKSGFWLLIASGVFLAASIGLAMLFPKLANRRKVDANGSLSVAVN